MKQENSEFKCGIISGLGLGLWYLVEFFLGYHTAEPEIGKYTSGFAAVILAGVVFFALRNKLAEENVEILSALELMKSALIISLAGAIIGTSFLYIFYHYLGSEWVESTIASQRLDMIDSSFTEADIEAHKEAVQLILAQRGQMLKVFVIDVLAGCFSGLLFALISRKRTSGDE